MSGGNGKKNKDKKVMTKGEQLDGIVSILIDLKYKYGLVAFEMDEFRRVDLELRRFDEDNKDFIFSEEVNNRITYIYSRTTGSEEYVENGNKKDNLNDFEPDTKRLMRKRGFRIIDYNPNDYRGTSGSRTIADELHDPIKNRINYD